VSVVTSLVVASQQAELSSFKKQRALMNDSSELQHAELLRMKEEALHYSADLRRSLMDLADSHAALLMALEPLMDGGRGADVDELEGVAAASFTAARVGEAASQVLTPLGDPFGRPLGAQGMGKKRPTLQIVYGTARSSPTMRGTPQVKLHPP
jgi:hypothetical protein